MIKWIFRWAFRLLILLVILVVAAILLLDTFAREYVEYQIQRQTGMPVKIGRVHIGLANPQLTIENMVLYNRPEFSGSPFVEMPELHVEYDRDALLAHKLRCKLVRFNLARINVVEDKNGRRNFEAMQTQLAPAGTVAKNAKPRQLAGGMDFGGIDTLNLTLGKVTYLRMKEPGKKDEFQMNVDHQIFTGIKSEQDFSGVLLVALLKSGANVFQNGGNGQNLMQLFAPPKK